MSGSKKGRPAERDQNQTGVMVDVLKGGAFGFVLVMILLGVSGLLVYLGWIGWAVAEIMLVPVCLFGGFAAGLTACGKCKGGALLCGAGAGAIVFVMLLSLAVMLPGTEISAGQGSADAALCLCGGLLAGLLRKNRKKRRR